MQLIETSLPGVHLLRPRLFSDPRGHFLETYNRERFSQLGIHDEFVQDNQSYSLAGSLRGLHYQLKHPQAKLCRVVSGSVFDVVVDIRVGSPNFGQSYSVELSAENQLQLYVPKGFAHGFLVRSGSADFLYKCSDLYHPEDEYGILWNDPALAIPWRIDAPLLSPKDSRYPLLSQAPAEHLPQYRDRL